MEREVIPAVFAANGTPCAPKIQAAVCEGHDAAIGASGLEQAAKAPIRAPAGAGDKPSSAEQWVHEIKVDGYRLQMHVQQQQARLFTRRGHDWTDRFEALAAAAWWLETSAAVLDGEVVAAFLSWDHRLWRFRS